MSNSTSSWRTQEEMAAVSGGAPGKAYLGYHEALVKRDAKALWLFLSNENRETLADAEKKGKAAAEL